MQKERGIAFEPEFVGCIQLLGLALILDLKETQGSY